MPVRSYKHRSGRTVHIDAMLIETTYGGVLEGRLSVDSCIKFFEQRREELWGERATHLIPPKVVDDRLPAYRVAVWLNSFEPIYDGCGSELVLAWFTDDPRIPDDIEALLPSVEWDSLAADWEP